MGGIGTDHGILRLLRILGLAWMMGAAVALAQTEPDLMTFGLRDASRCGDADPSAEGFLSDLLEQDAVRQVLSEHGIAIPLTIGYLSGQGAVCRAFRRWWEQSESEYEFLRAAHGDPRGWPDLWVRDVFLLDAGAAEVGLQSSEAFQRDYDEEQPLTTVWPGRTGSVAFYDAGLERIAVYDLLGRRLDLDE